MTRDMDLVRAILLEVEKLPHGSFYDISVPNYTESEINYHIRILDEAGYIEAMDLSTFDGACWKPKRLTWAGHEFLDKVRSDNVYQKAKDLALRTTGALSVDAVKMAAERVVKELFNG